MFEDINKSLLTQYAPNIKRLDFEQDFKESGYTDREEFKKSLIRDKVGKSNLNNRSNNSNPYHFTPYEGGKYMGAPLLDKSKEVQKTSLQEKVNDKYLSPLKDKYNNFLERIAKDLPNSNRDVFTASSLGVETKQTMFGKVGSIVGASEYTGYNPITKSNINIDYLSNKIDNQNRFPINDSDGFIRKSLKNTYNNFSETLGERNLEKWKQMHIDETAKSVRTYGANINPFDSGENLDYVRHNMSGVQGPPNRNAMFGNESLSAIKERDSLQLKEVQKRINDSQNNIKKFFNPLDKEELSSLESMQRELTERISRIDKGYGASRIQTEALSMPQSVSESFKDLQNRREVLYNQINSNINSNTRTGIAFPEEELRKVNSQLASNSGMFNDFHVTSPSSNLAHPTNLKDYTPRYGMTGYGLGFMNSWKASRTEHLVRGMNYLNPVGVGGLSAGQAVMETFGIMNKAQRMQVAQSRGFAKLGNMMVPGLGALQLGMGIYNKDDAGQIFEDMFSMGTSLAGWRVGTAFGGAATGAGSIGRLVGLGIGGLTGMALGYGLGTAAVGGVRDIMSNESKIRSFAKKIATKESMVSQVGTHQSLTQRMSSLQKLAKSGLNDRNLLLGSEATVLATGG